MPIDFVEAQGSALLAHRLKRLSDLFLAGARDVLPDLGVTAPPNALSTLLLLDEAGPLAIGDIAQRLRLSHPMVIDLTRELEAQGALATETDPADRRRRLARLTPQGRDQAAAVRRANAALAGAYAELSREVGADLYDLVQAVEQACRQTPFGERLRHAAAQPA